MKQLYHLYVVYDDVDNIHFFVDAKELAQVDTVWNQILEEVKQEPPQDVLEELKDKIEALM